MRQTTALNSIDILSEEIRRTQCARLGLMSLDESAYVLNPVMRPMAILEAKSIIRFGISTGYYPSYYSYLLESNDVISLRLSTKPEGELVKQKLDESFGMDLALGVGQMIPGVKTFAGIAGVAYYAYEAYESFQSGSMLGGAGNLFLTLLSAAAIEPLGAAAWTGPIVTALGPLTKLGQAFESFMGLIVKGAFGPVAKLLAKTPGLEAFIKWAGEAGLPALEGAGGWLAKQADNLAAWLAEKGAVKAAAGTAEGRLAEVAGYLSKRVGDAASLMSKFITNLKTFITSGGAKWAAGAEGAAAKAAGEAGEAGAVAGVDAARAAVTEANAAVKAAEDTYKALVNQQLKASPDLAAKYAGNETQLLNDLNGTRVPHGLEQIDTAKLRRAAEALEKAKAAASSAEAAVTSAAGSGAAAAAPEAAAGTAGGSVAQTPAALRNLGSAIGSDLRSFHSFLDQQAGKLLSKAENAQVKGALKTFETTPVVFKNAAGDTFSYQIGQNGLATMTKTAATGGTERTTASITKFLETDAFKRALVNQGMPMARAQAIGRGLMRGLAAGAAALPQAEAAAGL